MTDGHLKVKKEMIIGRLKRFWHWLFSVPDGKRSVLQIIFWWELRRIPYNILVGSVGFASFLVFLAALKISKPDADFELLIIIMAPVFINIAYTLGWLAELTLRILWRDELPGIGPALLKLGLTFSLAVVLAPSVYWVGFYLLHLYGLI